MSGSRYSAPPWRRLLTIGLTPSKRLSMRTSPKRERPAFIQASTRGFGCGVKIEVKARGTFSDKAMPPASRPKKCGEKMIVGVWPSNSCQSPIRRMRRFSTSREACQSQPRSSQDCAKYTKARRAQRRRCAAPASGKHRARFTATTRRRGTASR